MATIKFFLQSDKNPAGIYVRLRDGKNIDAKAKTNLVIDPINWSEIKTQHKGKDAQAKVLNQKLSELKNNLLNHYNSCAGNDLIDSNWLKEFINPIIQEYAVPIKLVPYFDYYISIKKNIIEVSSENKLKVVKHLLERFQKKMKKEYLIKDVDADFKMKFEQYCLADSYAKNTISKAIRFIKTICFHARNNGVETHYQLNSIQAKYEKADKIYLTVDDLKKIRNATITQPHLENARDWLIISCETGQRVSDFMLFTKEKIRIEDGVPLIEFTQRKTQKKMSIPISRKARDILNKRNGEFPKKISDQRYNEFIKEVCKIAGLSEKIDASKIDAEKLRKVKGHYPKYELVSSHIGRRTFATNNYGIIPTPYLIYMTGHSTENQFLEYIGKTPTETAKQIVKYFL